MLKKISFLPPLALATILAIGFNFVIILVVGWVKSWVEKPDSRVLYSCRENVLILDDGTPLIRREARDNTPSIKLCFPGAMMISGDGTYTAFGVRTLEGKPLDLKADSLQIDYKSQQLAHLPVNTGYDSSCIPLEPNSRLLDLQSGYRNLHSSTEMWYFIHDGRLDGKAYFVGYDSKTKLCLGYLGRKGYIKEIPGDEDAFPFDGRLMYSERYLSKFLYREIGSIWSRNYDQVTREPIRSFLSRNEAFLVSEDEVFDIDLYAKIMKPIIKAPNLISGGALWWNTIEPNNLTTFYWVFRSSKKLFLFDESKKQVGEFVIPEKLRKGDISVALVKDNLKTLILHTTADREDIRRQNLDWIDPEGKILRHEEITYEQDIPANKPKYEPKCDWSMAFMLPSPIELLILLPTGCAGGSNNECYADAFHRNLAENWQALLIFFLVSALLAFFCYRRQRRYSLPITWIWMGFVLLFGVPGYLGYLFHRRWAVLEDCPVCKKKVPRDRDACSACGKSFPSPELKGIEVFA
jgi:hypothetical protein